MELQGTIKLIQETQEVGSNNFKKRGVVITTDEQYPQDIMIEFLQDKTEILDKYKVGQIVNIGINIRGREWVNPQGEVKYFNSINGWKIDEVSGGSEPPLANVEPVGSGEEDDDNLPF